MTDEPGVATYGLDEGDLLDVATRLAPTTFGALKLVTAFGVLDYPLTTVGQLEEALASVADSNGNYESDGFRVTAQAPSTSFPKELFPVVDKADFVRKVYLAALMSHRGQNERALGRLQREGLPTVSHPLPEGLDR